MVAISETEFNYDCNCSNSVSLDAKGPGWPAVLKASLNQQGIECTAIDFNVDIFTKVKNHPHRHKLEDFFFKQIIHDDVISDVSAMIMHCRDAILKLNPSIIALSLFCNECQVFTAWLAAALKEQSPHCCIVIGGPGVNPAT
jgi:hypothetical protein